MQSILFDQVSKQYASGVRALDSVSFQIEQGDFFALLGPNGAGKSTLIGILTTLLNKTSGRVVIGGVDLDQNPNHVKSQVGVVPQEFNFNIFQKVEDILLNQAGFYGIGRKLAKQRSDEYLNKLGLWDKRHAVVRELSGGMKRRVMIARGLMHNPKVLVLDEPTAGVDIELRRSMWAFIRDINDDGVTILLTTHYLEEAESLCRNIAIIDQGKIIECSAMATLLSKLETECFILYLSEPVEALPDMSGCLMNKVSDTEVEIILPKDYPISRVFSEFSQSHISIDRVKNKSSRLEELFLQLTGGRNINES